MISYSAYMRHFYINIIYPMASVLFHDDTQSIFILLAYEWTKVSCTVLCTKYIDHSEWVEGMRLSRCHINGHLRNIYRTYSVFFRSELIAFNVERSEHTVTRLT